MYRMLLTIFKKISSRDFEEVEVELISFRDHSIDVRKDKKIITLSWDKEYPFDLLKIGNVLFIYVEDDDLSRAHVCPIVQGFNSRNMETFARIKSKLDKLQEYYEKKIQDLTEIIHAMIDFQSLVAKEDVSVLKSIITRKDIDKNTLNKVITLIEKGKEESMNAKT